MKYIDKKNGSVGLRFAAFVVSLLGTIALSGGVLLAQLPSDRFVELENHILGTDTMTLAELASWLSEFPNSEAGTLGNRFDDFLAAVETVELYEDRIGPLFTGQGQVSFLNSPEGETNLGRALGRAMLRVYQAVFDAIDSDMVSQRADLVRGVMFRSTENFPGTVPNPTDPSAIYQVQIDGTLNEEFGSPGGYHTNTARRMTGAYLAPGTVVDVIVPQSLVNAGFQIRVGGHSWDLSVKPNANRLHRVSNVFDITGILTSVANPMGGNIYIEVPVGADAGIVNVFFRNHIRAPFFSNRNFQKTTQSQWENTERLHPGAFADIESEHSLWTVPSRWVDDLGYDELMEIIEAHDANIQVASEYVGKNAERHKAILYMIVDTQIRANVFSIGYPQSNYGSFARNERQAPLTLEHATDEILWHEHGHAELVTMFSGESESWNHMLATVIQMENNGMTVQEGFARSLAFGSTRHDSSDALNSWVVMDEFINNNGMAFQQGSFRPRGHGDYVEYIEMFGLDAIKRFNRRINLEMDGLVWETDWPYGRTTHNANNRILRLSREAGVSVAPLFHLWGHRPSNLAALNADLASEGLGESVQIYDRMIRARDEVPLSQAQWNAVDSVMRDFLNNARGPWPELRSNYDVARGQAAVDQIQELIDLYFPNGRPNTPAVDPIAANVVAFSEPNFGGVPWELGEGIFLNVDLDAGPIGNNAISSFLIPVGFEVEIFDFSVGTGTNETFTSSVADLGNLDNTPSRVEVRSTLESQEPIGEASTIQLDHLWRTVAMTRSYDDPVVIAGVPSYEGVDPGAVRIRNVTSDSFEVQFDEWAYLNPFHAPEVVSYMVLEAGQYTLDDGTVVVAGNQTGQDHNWQTYSLGSNFGEQEDTPLVLANVVTVSDTAPVTTRINVISNSQFEVRLQEEEAADDIHGAETISYFAVQPGAGATGGLHFDAGSFEAGNSGEFSSFDSRVRLGSSDGFFAAMQSFVGSDTTTLRYTILNAAGARVFTEEERSQDAELSHSAETIGFFAINSGIIMGSVMDSLLLGDVNLDGVVNFSDIPSFISILSGGGFQAEADLNQDGVVNFSDIPAFIDVLRV